MPRYFFHVKRGQVTVLDQEGIELANPAQAEEEAARLAQQVWRVTLGTERLSAVE